MTLATDIATVKTTVTDTFGVRTIALLQNIQSVAIGKTISPFPVSIKNTVSNYILKGSPAVTFIVKSNIGWQIKVFSYLMQASKPKTITSIEDYAINIRNTFTSFSLVGNATNQNQQSTLIQFWN